MPSDGPRYPGTVATEIGPSGDDDWVSPTNVSADDGTQAQITAASFDATDQSYRLKATNFGFDAVVPAGATINGITVEIDRRCFAGAAQDQEVRLYDSSATLVGDDKQTATAWPATLETVSYGGASDTWNASLDADDIRSSSFGVALIVLADGANTDIGVDFIRVTVDYTPPPDPPTAYGSGRDRFPGQPGEWALRRPAFPMEEFSPAFVEEATIGGALAAGAEPVAIASVTAGGAVADGNAPLVVAPLTIGGALADGNFPDIAEGLTPGGAVADGNSATALVPLTIEGAVAGGNAPAEDIGGGGVTETPTPGGAVAAGNGPTAVAGLTAGGAVSGGPSPSPAIVSLTIGGAVAGGAAPVEPGLSTPTAWQSGWDRYEGPPYEYLRRRPAVKQITFAPAGPVTETVSIGGASAAGNSPVAIAAAVQGGALAAGLGDVVLVPLTIGGALADGVSPLVEPYFETPVPGGALADGVGPIALVALTIAGALADGNFDEPLPWVPLTIGGANAAGFTPPEQLTIGGAVAGGFPPTAVTPDTTFVLVPLEDDEFVLVPRDPCLETALTPLGSDALTLTPGC